MKVISQNKKAQFDYFLTNNLEAGVVLKGPDIKEILNYGINLKESYVKIISKNNKPEVWLINANINNNADPKKLLLHKAQINKFAKLTREISTTLICTKAYLDDNGKVKVEVALGTGKKQHDKRNVIKERDQLRRG